MIPELDICLLSCIFCIFCKCRICHDHCLVALIKGSPGIGFLDRKVADWGRIVLALNSIAVIILFAKDIYSLVAGSFCHSDIFIAVLLQPEGTPFFIITSGSNSHRFILPSAALQSILCQGNYQFILMCAKSNKWLY